MPSYIHSFAIINLFFYFPKKKFRDITGNRESVISLDGKIRIYRLTTNSRCKGDASFVFLQPSSSSPYDSVSEVIEKDRKFSV